VDGYSRSGQLSVCLSWSADVSQTRRPPRQSDCVHKTRKNGVLAVKLGDFRPGAAPPDPSALEITTPHPEAHDTSDTPQVRGPSARRGPCPIENRITKALFLPEISLQNLSEGQHLHMAARRHDARWTGFMSESGLSVLPCSCALTVATRTFAHVFSRSGSSPRHPCVHFVSSPRVRKRHPRASQTAM
jgi:hypothetical protein